MKSSSSSILTGIFFMFVYFVLSRLELLVILICNLQSFNYISKEIDAESESEGRIWAEDFLVCLFFAIKETRIRGIWLCVCVLVFRPLFHITCIIPCLKKWLSSNYTPERVRITLFIQFNHIHLILLILISAIYFSNPKAQSRSHVLTILKVLIWTAPIYIYT